MSAMTTALPNTLTGHFLIAMPHQAEPPFSHGVTLLCQHDEEGAIGLLVNQLSDYRFGDVLAQMKLPCVDAKLAGTPVLIGGPVQQQRGFVLHREPGPWESTYRVNDMWSVTTSRDILVAMGAGEGPCEAILVLGYAGWDAGQLEQEIMDNAWLTAEAADHIVFDTPLQDRWNAAAGLVGVDPTQLCGYAGHA